MHSFSARPTVEADVGSLVPFINASWVRTYAPLIGAEEATKLASEKHTHALFEREIDANDALSFVAVDHEATIIGHIGGFAINDKAIYIDRLHVAPHWHGSGAASELIAVSAIKAKDICRHLELTVLEGNERAMAFYLKMDFEVDASRTPTDGLGSRSAITMVKPLNG